jgi:hypothetical protein
MASQRIVPSSSAERRMEPRMRGRTARHGVPTSVDPQGGHRAATLSSLESPSSA